MYDFFPFIVGIMGSLHCLGMCGPLVLAYSFHLAGSAPERGAGGAGVRSGPWSRAFPHHLAFHAGRLLTYGILGGLAAGLFRAADLSWFFSDFRATLNLSGGALLVFLGLVLLKVIPLPSFFCDTAAASSILLGRNIQRLFRSRSLGARMLLGMATGTLPCCLSWAMIVTAATTRDPVRGFITMVIFGLGTVPSLFAAGLSASVLSHKIRSMGERMAAFLVLIMGMVFILKGVGVLD
jgi:hypothetical protein